jgi:hypothetical protein
MYAYAPFTTAAVETTETRARQRFTTMANDENRNTY